MSCVRASTRWRIAGRRRRERSDCAYTPITRIPFTRSRSGERLVSARISRCLQNTHNARSETNHVDRDAVAGGECRAHTSVNGVGRPEDPQGGLS